MSWRCVTLGDVAEFVRGISFKPEDVANEQSPDVLPCFRTKNIQQELEESDLLYIPRRLVSGPDNTTPA
jgi:type I restriction enzyme S subunit